jgi:general secretion pathway protein D
MGLSACLLAGTAARAQTSAPPATATGDTQQMISLNFRDAPLEQVLAFYEELTGLTLLRAPNLGAAITLRGQARLTKEEALAAIESVLSMNNISIVPMGNRFAKVVQTGTARQEGLAVRIGRPDGALPETDALESRILDLKHIALAEAIPILQTLIRGTGKIQPIDRTNSLLVTDTSGNLQRILDVLDFIDQPEAARVETRVYELRFAKADEVALRLNELIAESQTQDARARIPGAAVTVQPVPNAPPGVIRAQRMAQTPEVDAADRGIISGRIKIVADERTNLLIILSRPENYAFFDRIITVLDRAVDPEVIVSVHALDYADAEETAALLNQFLGNSSPSTTGTRPEPGRTGTGADTADARGQALREYIARRAEARPVSTDTAPAGIGQLSPETKILSDKRSNSLLLMGRREDVASLLEVVNQIDHMLAQVMIEVVILEITLGDSLQYGISWLQRSMTQYGSETAGPGGGVPVGPPVASWGGAFKALKEDGDFRDSTLIDRAIPFTPGGLTYYLTLYDLNLDAILRAAATSGDARVLSTPVIMTTDNTEASIISAEQRPIVTQTSTTDGGEIRSSYEYKDIGLKLKVKPRINPDRVVVLEISQTADTPGDEVKVDNNLVPVIYRREMEATIAVPHRTTVALGGLVRNENRKFRSKIPILGDIPLIGWLFRGEDTSKARTELLVLITPYVITTPQEARDETARLHDRSTVADTDWHSGWPDGDLAKRQKEKSASKISLRQNHRTGNTPRGEKPKSDAPTEVVPPEPIPKAPSSETGPAAGEPPTAPETALPPVLPEPSRAVPETSGENTRNP